MVQVGNRSISLKQPDAVFWSLRVLIVEMKAMIRVEVRIKSDVVIPWRNGLRLNLVGIGYSRRFTCNHDLRLIICLLNPVQGLL